jgi:hypothetical protein
MNPTVSEEEIGDLIRQIVEQGRGIEN